MENFNVRILETVIANEEVINVNGVEKIVYSFVTEEKKETLTTYSWAECTKFIKKICGDSEQERIGKVFYLIKDNDRTLAISSLDGQFFYLRDYNEELYANDIYLINRYSITGDGFVRILEKEFMSRKLVPHSF